MHLIGLALQPVGLVVHTKRRYIWKDFRCTLNSFSSNSTGEASDRTVVAAGGTGGAHKTAMHCIGLAVHCRGVAVHSKGEAVHCKILDVLTERRVVYLELRCI